MQRLLSIATLVALGAGVWMFLSGGGLSQLAAPGAGEPGATGASPGALDNLWNQPTAQSTPTTGGYPPVQPAAGASGPPIGQGPTIRIASFNIEVFGTAKLNKPNVVHTLAEIVRQFHVVAVQEIRTSDAYHAPNFVKLVNATGRKYDHVIGPPIGNTTQTEQYAYIFDTERVEVDSQSVYTVGDPDNLLHREPLVASFRTRGPHPDEAFTFVLVNVHTDPNVVPKELEALAEAYRVVRRSGRGEDDVIILGDFNADDAHLGRLGQIPGMTPLIRGAFSNTRQNRLYDNVCIHQPSTTEYTGRSGVFNFMTQLGVQLTLDQGEQVSDHLPVWAEFSAYERDYEGRIASRRANTR